MNASSSNASQVCRPGKPAVIASTGHCATHSAANSASPASTSFTTAPLKAASKPTTPARSPNQRMTPKLIQAPIEVASARPTWASVVKARKAILKAMLMAAADSAAFTGVAVSPRARDGAVTLHRGATHGDPGNTGDRSHQLAPARRLGREARAVRVAGRDAPRHFGQQHGA